MQIASCFISENNTIICFYCFEKETPSNELYFIITAYSNDLEILSEMEINYSGTKHDAYFYSISFKEKVGIFINFNRSNTTVYPVIFLRNLYHKIAPFLIISKILII